MPKTLPKWERFWSFELFFKNEAINQKSGTVKLLGYVWTCSDDNSGTRKLILSLPRPYSEAHEKACFLAFWSASKEKWLLKVKKSIFKKLFKMSLRCQNNILITFQGSETGLESISDSQDEFGAILRKIKKMNFQKFFASLLSIFYA